MSDSVIQTTFFVSASLLNAMTAVLPKPPCIFCGEPDAQEITPVEMPPKERWYACDHCGRRFAVKFTPIPEPSKPS